MATAKSIVHIVLEKITDTNELSDAKRRLIAVLCMFITVFLSFFKYSQVKNVTVYLFWTYSETVSANIIPTLNSTLLSIMLLASIFVRNRIKISYYNIILYILNLLFTSSLLSVFVAGEPWNVPFINISSQSLVMFAIVFVWIGMRAMAGFIWLFVFFLSIFRLADVSFDFGLVGVIYIISGFIGIICQIRDVNGDIISAFKEDFFGYRDQIAGDISSATDRLKVITKI